jgi:hypothetical protein
MLIWKSFTRKSLRRRRTTTNLAKGCAGSRTPNPNGALLWFPPVEQAGLPVPRTEFVHYEPSWLWPVLDGEAAAREFRMEELVAACEKIGYPAFLHTDLASAKHDGQRYAGSIRQTS